MTRRFTFLRVIVHVLVVGAVLSAACGRSSEERFIAANGRYQTNSLTRAQAQTPFKITIPRYVPYDMAGTLRIQGTLREDQQEEHTEITVAYFAERRALIVISEADGPPNSPFSGPNSDGVEEVLLRDGMSVEVYPFINADYGSSYQCWWFQDGVNYVAETYGVSRDETLKVIASMIR